MRKSGSVCVSAPVAAIERLLFVLAAVLLDAGLVRADGVELVARVGGYGVWFRRGCKRCRIARNEVHDLGAGGVRLGEPRMARTDEAMSSHNEIVNKEPHYV